jgi:hypothetical protein
MRAVHEAAQVIRRAVDVRGRVDIDAVVAPAEPSGELRNRHHLDGGDADAGELVQLAHRRCPRALARERSGMQLVDDLPVGFQTRPPLVRPSE